MVAKRKVRPPKASAVHGTHQRGPPRHTRPSKGSARRRTRDSTSRPPKSRFGAGGPRPAPEKKMGAHEDPEIEAVLRHVDGVLKEAPSSVSIQGGEGGKKPSNGEKGEGTHEDPEVEAVLQYLAEAEEGRQPMAQDAKKEALQSAGGEAREEQEEESAGGAPSGGGGESKEGGERGKKPPKASSCCATFGIIAGVVSAACAVIGLCLKMCTPPAPLPSVDPAPPPSGQTGPKPAYSIAPPVQDFCSLNANPAYFASVARENNVYDTRKLLGCNMSPDTEEAGMTVLMISAESGSMEVAGILVSMGANPHIENESGDTALVFAAVEGHMDIVKVLTSKGANLVPRKKVLGKDEPPCPSWGIDDAKAEELRELSRSKKNPEGFLISKGFTRYPERNRERVNAIKQVVSGGKATPSDLRELLKIKGACVNPSAACGMGSPLVSAASRLELEKVRILLKNGAGPNAREYMGPQKPRRLRMGKTAMIAAAGAESCDERKDILPILELLLVKGADPNLTVPEEYGKSALNAAELAGNTLAAKFLREHGARE